MSLEKILDKILEEAQDEADKILLEGRRRAGEIVQNARSQAEAKGEIILEQAEKEGNLEASRLVTQARLEKRLRILRYKKELIDDVLEKAFQKHQGDQINLKRKVILKDGEQEESVDREELKQVLRPKLEKYIAGVLKI